MADRAQGGEAPICGWSLERLGEWVYRLCLDFGSAPETAHRVAAEFVAGIREARRATRSAATLALVALCLAGCGPSDSVSVPVVSAEQTKVPVVHLPDGAGNVYLIALPDGTSCAVFNRSDRIVQNASGGISCGWPQARRDPPTP